MSLMDKLRADRRQAQTASDEVTASLLQTLIGEATRVGKDDGNRPSTDEEITATIRSFLKGATETLRLAESSGREDVAVASRAEIVVLKGYLPSQMDEAALRKAIADFVAVHPGTNMGAVMGYLKVAFTGLYDGRQASGLTKEILAG